jgi:cold shock CspA family protein
MRGKIVMWRADAGYGFISPNLDDGKRTNIFVHQKQVRNRVALCVGDVVTYAIGQGRDGRKYAIDVVPVDDAQ